MLTCVCQSNYSENIKSFDSFNKPQIKRFPITTSPGSLFNNSFDDQFPSSHNEYTDFSKHGAAYPVSDSDGNLNCTAKFKPSHDTLSDKFTTLNISALPISNSSYKRYVTNIKEVKCNSSTDPKVIREHVEMALKYDKLNQSSVNVTQNLDGTYDVTSTEDEDFSINKKRCVYSELEKKIILYIYHNTKNSVHRVTETLEFKKMGIKPSLKKKKTISNTSNSNSEICKTGFNQQLHDISVNCEKRVISGGGDDVTLSELREMATRQQQQIESQQQLLVAREQRLKYLKQQEGRSAQTNLESERLRRLKERVEAQEAKLRRLRALRGQMNCTQVNASSLSCDLDAMRHLFSEKEKELVDAAAKVELLTRQLEQLRSGHQNNDAGVMIKNAINVSGQPHQFLHIQQQELDKLRRELLYRNGVNREAASRVNNQREALSTRKEEVTKIDKRISDLQQRLYKKRLLNQQLVSQISAATQAKQAQLKAVEQKSKHESNDELISNNKSFIDSLQFERGYQDPKYQTLPYNTKFQTKSPLESPKIDEIQTSTSSDGTARTVHSTPMMQPLKSVAYVPRMSNANEATYEESPTNSSITTSCTDALPAVHFSDSPCQSFKNGVHHSNSVNAIVDERAHKSGNQHSQVHKDETDRMLNNSFENNFINFGDEKVRPILPPKPPNKPTPPPRQKGDPLVGSTESLVSIGSGSFKHNIRQHGLKYANQNSTLPTHTQKIEDAKIQGYQENNGETFSEKGKLTDEKVVSSSLQPEKKSEIRKNSDSNRNLICEDSETATEKVHISLNRRIEMPPDFLFPEDATPPSDLLGNSPKKETSFYGNQNPTNQIGYDDTDKVNTKEILNYLNNNRNENGSKNLVENANDSKRGTHESDSSCTNQIINEAQHRVKFNHDESNESERLNNIKNKFTKDFSANEKNENEVKLNEESNPTPTKCSSSIARRLKKGNLKSSSSDRVPRRVSFDPLALLLDASLEGELELVKRTAMEVPNPSAANDEGITALHNAICAGHLDIVTFLVTFGCDVNAQDSDGWTPLHCAASCNNVSMVRFLVEHGACVLATTLSDHETAAEKCEQDEEGYDGCSQYLYSVQEKLGIMNNGVAHAVFDYEAQNEDELSLHCGDALTVLRRGDEYEREWWWASLDDEKCGYVPSNLLGLYPRVKNPLMSFRES